MGFTRDIEGILRGYRGDVVPTSPHHSTSGLTIPNHRGDIEGIWRGYCGDIEGV